MLLLLLEQEYNCITSTEEHLTGLYNKASVQRILGKRVDDSTLSALSRKPLLDGGWLILCTERIDISVLKKINQPFNNVVMVVRNKAKVDLAREKLEGLEFKYIDNYFVKEETVLDWIQSQLQCTKGVAKSMYTRCGKRLKQITLAVELLRGLDKVTVTQVERYVPKVSAASVDDVVLYLIGVRKAGITRDNVVRTISEFQYASKWLLGAIEKKLEAIQMIFMAMSFGILTTENCNEYLSTCDNKVISKMTEYQLHKITLLREETSSAEVTYVLNTVRNIRRTRFGLYRLLQLLS